MTPELTDEQRLRWERTIAPNLHRIIRADKSSVYFIEANGFVKIGSSVDAGRRLRCLQTSNPTSLRLIGVIPGGRSAELLYHKIFSSYKSYGEWFQIYGRLAAFLNETFSGEVFDVTQRETLHRDCRKLLSV